MDAKGKQFVQLLNVAARDRWNKAVGDAGGMVMSIRMLSLARQHLCVRDRAGDIDFCQNVKQQQ
jgi:hypothetical protein